MVFHTGGIVNLRAVAVSNFARKNSIAANDFLQWNLIKYYKNKGFSIIDWVGYNLNAKKGSKLDNINRFNVMSTWINGVKVYNRGKCFHLSNHTF